MIYIPYPHPKDKIDDGVNEEPDFVMEHEDTALIEVSDEGVATWQVVGEDGETYYHVTWDNKQMMWVATK